MKQGIYLAFVYIGLVIGAGFASGREIMQYFNFPSNTYHGGIVLATFLLIAVCYIILNRCYNYGISTFNEYLSLVAGKAAATVQHGPLQQHRVHRPAPERSPRLSAEVQW